MDPLTIAAVLGGVGLAKSAFIDTPKENRDRELAAETQRYSPWTGLKAGEIREADPLGSTLQGGVSGYMLGQNMEKQKLQNKWLQADINRMNLGLTPSAKVGFDMNDSNFFGADSYAGARSNAPSPAGNPWSLF